MAGPLTAWAAQARKPHLCTFLFSAVTDLLHVMLLDSCWETEKLLRLVPCVFLECIQPWPCNWPSSIMWMPVICMHARRVELERIRGQRRSCSQGKPLRQNKPRGRKRVSKCARPFLPCFRTRCFVLQWRRGSSGATVWGAARLRTVCNPPCFLFPDVCLSHVLQSIWPAARQHRLMVEIRIETYLCLSHSPSSCFSHVFFYFCVFFFSL